MYTRRVIMNIRPGAAAEAARIVEDEVNPGLRGQRGMRYADAFISPELSEAVLNSYWDTRECAESYGRAAYPVALSALARVSEGTPLVETFNVSSATFHRLTAPRRAAHRTSRLVKGVSASAKLIPDLGGRIPPALTRARKRILKIGVYRTGDLASEVTTLDDVNVRAEGDTALFTGHATVKSRFKGRDSGSLYRLSKVYEKQQGRWRIIASQTARLGGRMNREVGGYGEDNAETARFEGDDVGLPEHPIYSNFSKNLWRSHPRHGLVQSPNRSREGTSEHMPTQDNP